MKSESLMIDNVTDLTNIFIFNQGDSMTHVVHTEEVQSSSMYEFCDKVNLKIDKNSSEIFHIKVS